MSSLDYLDLCRLCLVKDRVSVPIFEDEGDVRQIFLKITACLPVKVSRDDKLPKKICDDCVYKVELFYQFWNTTASAEKQLLQWLGEVGGLEDKQGYVTEVLDTNVMKQERNSDNRLDGSVLQVSGHQNSMDMGMMDNISLITMPAGNEQQFAPVPIDTSGTVQTVQAVPGPSTQNTHDAMTQSQTSVSHLVEEEEESEEDENSDDGCDNEEGLPVKEETEDDQTDRPLEPTTFVSLPCDEAGPSGLQQQKISEISEMTMSQTTDGDPKTGKDSGRSFRKQSIVSRIRVRTASELTNSNSLQLEKPTGRTTNKVMPKKPAKPTSKRKRSVPSKISNDELDIEIDTVALESPSKSTKLLNSTSKSEESKETASEVKKETREPLLYKKLKDGDFGCKVCHQRFSHRYKIKQHIKLKHAPRETFKCDDCGKTFKSKYQFNTHANQHRENSSDYLFCCDKCEYRAKSKHYLKTHEIRKHTNEYNFECDHCGRRFKMKMDLKFHLGTHGASQHMCDACGRMYTSQDSLYKHRRVVHLNDYKFQCQICHQKLLTQENFNSHMESHKKLHSCDECDLKFTKKYYVTRHKKRVHKVEKTNLCPVCGKAFVCMATLRVHYLTHAKVKPYMCNVCGFSFTQRSSMMLHWKRKHPDAEDPPPPVILTNFFDAIQSEVNKLVETTTDFPSSESCQTSGATAV